MDTATLPVPPTPRLALLRRVVTRGFQPPEAYEPHLHFDREARVWRSHDDLSPFSVHRLDAAAALPECA